MPSVGALVPCHHSRRPPGARVTRRPPDAAAPAARSSGRGPDGTPHAPSPRAARSTRRPAAPGERAAPVSCETRPARPTVRTPTACMALRARRVGPAGPGPGGPLDKGPPPSQHQRRSFARGTQGPAPGPHEALRIAAAAPSPRTSRSRGPTFTGVRTEVRARMAGTGVNRRDSSGTAGRSRRRATSTPEPDS
ncbi:hypothetical protein ACTIVE_8111 [Actinomadura verrucosospora]|uniref:Uncharacterized protein n=1 Tax=Actinomadura verrucosospora TaxID=46165 RepID=A0A7D3W0F1_ACTVE|nr:hypothetical protein ACTIVE_8111 [Actinomadura verrucosospora]